MNAYSPIPEGVPARQWARSLADSEARIVTRAFWDRGDGWDNNHPDAPPCWRCDQCDGFRFTDAPAFCAACEEVTGCYANPSEIAWTMADSLPRVTTPVRTLNPDLWPDLKGDDL